LLTHTHTPCQNTHKQDVTATKGHEFEDYFLKRELLMGIYEKVRVNATAAAAAAAAAAFVWF